MRWIIAPDFDIVESPHRFLSTDAAEQIKRGTSNCKSNVAGLFRMSATRLAGDSPGGLLFLIYYRSCQLRTDRLSWLRSTTTANRHYHGVCSPWEMGTRRDTLRSQV